MQMPHFGFVACALICTLALVACGASAPTCDSTEAKSLVIQLFSDNESQKQQLINVATEDARSSAFQESSKVQADVAELHKLVGVCEKNAFETFKKRYQEQFTDPVPPSAYNFLFLEENCPKLIEMDRGVIQACAAISEGRACIKKATAPVEQKSHEAQAKLDTRLQEIDKAVKAATYSVDTIRVTAKNDETGAIVCAARLSVDIPSIGGAEQQVAYKVERTTDGKLYVTMLGW